MVVIRPKLDICWSYVAIYMYMTNILIVVYFPPFVAPQVLILELNFSKLTQVPPHF